MQGAATTSKLRESTQERKKLGGCSINAEIQILMERVWLWPIRWWRNSQAKAIKQKSPIGLLVSLTGRLLASL